MKKLGCILMAMVLVFASMGCLAEEAFTIHSGVQFGMTREEVIQKEKDAGYIDIKEIELDKSDRFNCSLIHQSSAVSVSGEIVGVKGANIEYHFDKEGKMDSAIYLLGADIDIPGYIEVHIYPSIREALIRKYGEPNPSLAKILHSNLHMDVFNYNDYYISEYNETIDYEIVYEYNDTWLIPQGNEYIIISGIMSSHYINRQGQITITHVCYQRFDKEEVDQIIDSYNRQLADDL